MDGLPTLCHFEHPGFAALGAITFRLTNDDQVAALALSIDSLDVVLPLRSVAQLFGIRPDSPDGRMLHLVEHGLRFVPSMQIGDKLPLEVLTGEASWQPREYHRQAAAAKLQLQLVAWIGGSTDVDETHVTPQMLIVAIDDPAIRLRVEEALRRAAAQLSLEGGGEAVARLIEEAARELSYFEAMREWLLDRVRVLAKRLVRIAHEMPSLGAARRETLVQVVRLATAAVVELGQQFEVVDAQTTDTLSLLQNLERHRGFLRPNRDRLYSTLLVWDPILTSWENLPGDPQREPEGIWRTIDESYRFLAPRYMVVQEWKPIISVPDKTERNKAAVVW